MIGRWLRPGRFAGLVTAIVPFEPAPSSREITISNHKDMNTVSQSTLRRRYLLACDRLGVPKGRFPYQTRPLHDGSPHVEVLDGLYYVVTERGEELQRRSTHEADELLYWLLQGVTFSLACDFELRHRVPGQDFRRILFTKQLELLRGLDPAGAEESSRDRSHTPPSSVQRLSQSIVDGRSLALPRKLRN